MQGTLLHRGVMTESPYLTVPHRSEWGDISPGSSVISWPNSKVNTILIELSINRQSVYGVIKLAMLADSCIGTGYGWANLGSELGLAGN